MVLYPYQLVKDLVLVRRETPCRFSKPWLLACFFGFWRCLFRWVLGSLGVQNAHLVLGFDVCEALGKVIPRFKCVCFLAGFLVAPFNSIQTFPKFWTTNPRPGTLKKDRPKLVLQDSAWTTVPVKKRCISHTARPVWDGARVVARAVSAYFHNFLRAVANPYLRVRRTCHSLGLGSGSRRPAARQLGQRVFGVFGHKICFRRRTKVQALFRAPTRSHTRYLQHRFVSGVSDGVNIYIYTHTYTYTYLGPLQDELVFAASDNLPAPSSDRADPNGAFRVGNFAQVSFRDRRDGRVYALKAIHKGLLGHLEHGLKFLIRNMQRDEAGLEMELSGGFQACLENSVSHVGLRGMPFFLRSLTSYASSNWSAPQICRCQ